jgi:hypothetical protein
MPRRAGKSDAAVARAGKRYPLNMRTTFEIRSKLEAAAAESGRSLAQEAESLIERALQLDKVLAAMNTSLEKMENDSRDAELIRIGYIIVQRDPDTHKKLWAEPGYPGTEHLRSDWLSPKEGQ